MSTIIEFINSTMLCFDDCSSSTKYWDVLAGSVDLSSYQKIADLVAITNAEIDTILAS